MEHRQKPKQRIDLYKVVTDRIVALLEQGTVPWRRTWTDAGIPMNAVTKRPYTGINLMLLAFQGHERNLFLTYEQARDLGGTVRKGEKASMVVFVKRTRAAEAEDGETEAKEKTLSMLRYFSVFNVSQCDGLPEDIVPPPVTHPEPIPLCVRVLECMPQCPNVSHGGSEASYSPQTDTVTMPRPGAFESMQEYYAALFHELVHSTGHAKRLNRREVVRNEGRASEGYAAEELTAELGACYLRSFAGIGDVPLDNHAAYMATWLGRLRNDRRLLFRAASQAQRAVNWILCVESGYEPAEAEGDGGR